MKELIFSSPLFVLLPRKTKPARKFLINLNVYRNVNFFTNNEAKKIYCELMEKQLKGKKFDHKIEIFFKLYKARNAAIDRSNVLSITEKYFCDALVHHGCIKDDNDDFILETHYKSGGLDKENPRVEIIIK